MDTPNRFQALIVVIATMSLTGSPLSNSFSELRSSPYRPGYVSSGTGVGSICMERSRTNSTSASDSGPGIDLFVELRGPGLRMGLANALRDAVRTGRLGPDTRLPPSRSLAADLGVSRNTVTDAYAELVAEGWLTARQGSGTRVARRTEPHSAPRSSPRARAVRRHPTYGMRPGSPDLASFPAASGSAPRAELWAPHRTTPSATATPSVKCGCAPFSPNTWPGPVGWWPILTGSSSVPGSIMGSR